jgi:hypothetical protein
MPCRHYRLSREAGVYTAHMQKSGFLWAGEPRLAPRVHQIASLNGPQVRDQNTLLAIMH